MTRADRPNIILIITDQQRYDTIAALGFPYMRTPNLDRLIAEGAALTNCHITGASCVPSRASLFTGYYPHTIGVLRNGHRWRRSWVETLRDAGYRCVSVGKMHTVPYDAPTAFHERYIVENKDRYLDGRWFFDEWDKALAAHGLRKQQRELYRLRGDYRERLGAFLWELPEALHSDMFVGNFARWWVETHPVTEPLFLQVGFPGPHPPYDPTERFLKLYENRDDVPAPVPTQDELESLPVALKEKRVHDVEVDHDSVVWSLAPSTEQIRRMWAHYCANVTMIDEKIGELLGALRARGYLDNAVVLFCSDHGDCMGEHGLSQKWAPYDCVTRVPVIAWAPGRFPAGTRLDGLCQLFDLGPTVLELAGCDVPPSFEARSLAGALEGKGWKPRDFAFCEQAGDLNFTGTDYLTMVRSDRWKVVFYNNSLDGQIFDLADDPGETRNLWDDPAAQHVKAEYLGLHRDWLVGGLCRTAGLFAEAR